MQNHKLRIGVSRCLLGENVRHDGGHKKDSFLTEVLGQYVDWVPVCPEMEVGMGVPRESVQLVQTASGIRMMGVGSKKDWTGSMNAFSSLRAKQLHGLHAFIFKKDSPSCGMEHVRVFSREVVKKNGRGLFSDALIRMHSLMPVEEEGRLRDPALRENFIERAFCYERLTNLLVNPTPPDLIAFHARHKMTLLSHSPEHYRVLGRMAAIAGKSFPNNVLHEYSRGFMEALKRKATPRKHANVLQHLMGYLKKFLDSNDKEELIYCIEEYRREKVPLIVPITLLKHHFRRHPNSWIQQQTYLNPYPSELMLRNHV